MAIQEINTQPNTWVGGPTPPPPLTTPKAQRIAATADDATEKLEQKMMGAMIRPPQSVIATPPHFLSVGRI